MKRLIVCFDGTWNSADSRRAETNVARLARAVRATSGDAPQLTLYLRGVGSTGIALQKLLGGATGEGVDDNIRSGYMFLAQNYVPGDKIFLFGFSRGAFTARSLAGFMAACGLLMRQKLGDLSAAWDYYRHEVHRSPEDFCRRHHSQCHQDIQVAFLGVWDTVGALGIPGTVLNELTAKDYEFHDTTPSHIVRIGRHALAVDEHRDEFEPTLWTGAAPEDCDISQVWFAGAHSDVGGGYQNRLLADIPLRWMAREAEAAGLKLDWEMLPRQEDPLAPQHESRLNWSRKDRLTPTIRQVRNMEPEVTVLERLYRPMDKDGRPLETINESLHPSLTQRFGRRVTLLANDADSKGEKTEYRPKNLQPFFPR
ncbi:DUF2235 domain-containing protein [Pseudoroseomonas ludipueritiae]|uniref:DUF2235 domain-containing protein n=1 Tax=Pseudoroseomonas ludipueritiae TaxID=198093 RepID=A0ABR7R9E2_9PROT|nr:DUF2235 domain-containing protein [Pseudoroseomonas ludipueritiae]MBC9178319.1 DUF2235 domain-containing protein [Pseudoroseomonas ludipueritiae]